MAYVFLCVAVVLLSALYIVLKDNKWSRRFVFLAICLLLAWFAGSRTRYNDTGTYIEGFKNCGTDIRKIFEGPFSLSNVYLFNLWQFVIKNYLSSNEHVFLFLSSLIFVIPSVHLVCKYSENVPFSMFLYVWCSMFLFSLAGLKQALATGFFMMAIPFLIKRKLVAYYLLVFVAIGFHAYGIFCLLIPLLGRDLLNKRTMLTCVLLALLGVGMTFFSGVIESVVGLLGKDVDEETLLDGSVNVYRALVFLVPIVLLLIGRKNLSSEIRSSDVLLCKIALLSGVFMFVSLFGNPILFGRIPQYFIVGIVVEMPLLIRCAFAKADRKSVLVFATLLFALYGAYGLNNDGIFTRDVFGSQYLWF